MAGFDGFRQVAEFVAHNKRKTIRRYKNEYDKCTIVSIYPRDITELKHTIEPNRFFIPAGTLSNPSMTEIGSASWFREIDEVQPILEIPVSSVQLAESIINDSINGMVACNMGTHRPGLFFVPGLIEGGKEELFARFEKKILEVDQYQKNWFALLVKLADSMWARTNGNPLVIWDVQKLAATELGMDKPWLKHFQAVDLVKCAACGGMKNPLYPVCPSCRYIDPSHSMAESGEMKFA